MFVESENKIMLNKKSYVRTHRHIQIQISNEGVFGSRRQAAINLHIYKIIFISDIPFAIRPNTLNRCSLSNVDIYIYICFLDIIYVCFVNLFLPFHF